jgi:hypothetical protein
MQSAECQQERERGLSDEEDSSGELSQSEEPDPSGLKNLEPGPSISPEYQATDMEPDQLECQVPNTEEVTVNTERPDLPPAIETSKASPSQETTKKDTQSWSVTGNNKKDTQTCSIARQG